MRAGRRREAGEFGFLARLLPTLSRGRGTVVGPGDDCAVVRTSDRTLLTTDALVEDVHFRRDWLSPREIGAKSVLVNLSDIAAMGGQPRHVLLSIGVPPDFERGALTALHRGADAAARAAGASIVGGNLSAAERLFVSVAMTGEARRPLLRSGAMPGDRIFVTGTLGDAALAVDLLTRGVVRRSRGRGAGRQTPALARLVRRFAAPTPRLATGRMLAARGVASAMIDVSDGLVQDLGHICERSGVGAVVFEEEVPRSTSYERTAGGDLTPALTGGEDYELLFTVPRARLARLETLRRRLGDTVTSVGEIVAGRGVRVLDARGRTRQLGSRGYEHFR